MRILGISTKLAFVLCLCLLGSLVSLPVPARAATAQQINDGAISALDQLRSKGPAAATVLQDAKGVLVFPQVDQAGFVVGGEYGEGVLRVGGKSVGYYSIGGVSWGLQFGAQSNSVVIAFLTDEALQKFQAKANSGNYWQAGVDGSITLINVGAQAGVSTTTSNAPVVGFVFNQAGLMYSLSLGGAKISQIQR